MFLKNYCEYFTKSSKKIEEKGNFLYSFYVASITLITKPNKHITRKGNYRPTSTLNINKQQNTSKLNPTRYKNDYTP